MPKVSSYHALTPGPDGVVPYRKKDQEMWSSLFTQQIELVKTRATNEYLEGLSLLELTSSKIPQHKEINQRLKPLTGWQVEAVPAIIPADQFFDLLAVKKFPAACFIRNRQDRDYIEEPDIFHEVFGHCPLLTNRPYADFMEAFGKLAVNYSGEDRKTLFRLFWFTVEFGLINGPSGLKIYGGGILSSPEETVYALSSDEASPVYQDFDALEVLRTPFRIDILQPVYFVIENLTDLYSIVERDIKQLIQEARDLGDHPPLFRPKKKSTETNAAEKR